MPKINVPSVPQRKGSGYPAPFHEDVAGRLKQALGNAGGLTDFGVNLTFLPPGTWSSQRHWHTGEDEFVYILSGEVALVTDRGEEILRAGDCAAFPKNTPDGHHLINKGSVGATYLEVGSRREGDVCHYSDIDMQIDDKVGAFTHRDGTPYPKRSA
jgi:uncharacterized cupin superfamily protein